MLKSLARAAKSAVSHAKAVLDEARVIETRPDAHDERIGDLETRLAEAERYAGRSREYFLVIEKLVKEKDTWRDMYMSQSVENARAQEWMVSELGKLNQLLIKLTHLVNQERKLLGRPPFELAVKLEDGSEVKKRYDELLAELAAAAPKDHDYMAERAEITARHDAATGGDIRVESGDAATGELIMPVSRAFFEQEAERRRGS